MWVRLSSEINLGWPDIGPRLARGRHLVNGISRRIRYDCGVSEARIWSVFDKNGRLVLAISDQPGEFNFTRMPDDDVDPVECKFATVQCYAGEVEPEVLNILFRCEDLEDFLEQLEEGKFRVQPGRPQPSKFARL